MKKIGILLGLITVLILGYSVVFPKNMGNHTPIWGLKERFSGDEYRELRTEYFITLANRNLWYEMDSIFYVWNDHDIFTTTEVYLVVPDEIAEECKIYDTGIIRWYKQSSVRIDASALTDDTLSVRIGVHEYSLDETEESISGFEEATGIDAEELLDTISKIRSEYIAALQKLSEAEYQNVYNKIKKTIITLIIMWGIYILLYSLVRICRRLYENRLDRDMKKYSSK